METLKSTPLSSLLLLLLFALTVAAATASARKTGPPVPVSRQLLAAAAAPAAASSTSLSPSDAASTAAAAAAAAPVAAPSTSLSPSDAASTAAAAAAAASTAAAAPPTSLSPSDAASTAATAAAAPASAALPASGDQPLTFFMHDILGGTNPSARIVAGIVDDTAVNGQLPFARPNGAVLPVHGGVSVSGAGAGAVDNNNNIPFLTGLGGATNAVAQTNGNGNGVAGGLPFFAGGNLPEGASLQKLLFGTLTVMDDELTEGPELGSGVVGKAQGFYVASSEEGSSQTVALTAMLTAGDYADSVSLFGVHRTAESESHLAVVGGTGKYAGARGFAKVAVVRTPAAAHDTDGVESVLQFTVYLSAAY